MGLPAFPDADRTDTQLAAVRHLPVVRSNEALVDGLREGEPWARAELFDRFGAEVERVLVRILGPDQDRLDLMQDVFVRTLEGIGKLDDPARLRAWIVSIAIFTARERIRKRRRSRWLVILPPKAVPEQQTPPDAHEDHEIAQATYRVLDQLDPDERIALVLRLLEGLELSEVAVVCRVSLATIKRRITGARHRFQQLAGQDRVLAEWVQGGAQW
jgi:RNA polymerase sigma-70 factor, ECF subfamily